jgi:hypothetical protein
MFLVFVAQLTKDLNPRSLIYYILQVVRKTVNKAGNMVCLLYYILLTKQPFHNERSKNVLYLYFSVLV